MTAPLIFRRVGPNKGFTKEGFLVLLNVPISRTGVQKYTPAEVKAYGIDPAPHVGVGGFVEVDRPEAEVFSPVTLASGQGKPIVVMHPDRGADVDPKNYAALSAGHMVNVRRGAGTDSQNALADLVVTRSDVIAELSPLGANVEVSVGYDSVYKVIGGRVTQTNIVINHLALVPSGRCGPMCSTRDGNSRRAQTMKLRLGSVMGPVWRALATGDVAQIRDAVMEAEKTADADQPEGGAMPGHIEIHNHATPKETDDDAPVPAAEFAQMKVEHQQMLEDLEDIKEALDVSDSQIADMRKKRDARRSRDGGRNRDRSRDEDPEEKRRAEDKRRRDAEKTEETRKAEDARRRDAEKEMNLDAEAPNEENAKAIEKEGGPDAKKSRDSAPLADAWRDVVAKAEILAPGFKAPAFDQAARPARTVDSMCKIRDAALEVASAGPAASALAQANGGAPPVLKGMTCDEKRVLFHAAAALRGAENNGTVAGLAHQGGLFGVRKPPADFDFNRAMDVRYGRAKN